MTHAAPQQLASIVDYLDLHAALRPSEAAVIEAGTTTTYAQLRDAVNASAAEFVRLGLGAGSRVAYAGTPGLTFWVSFLSAVRAGAVWLGLNPNYSGRELEHVLSDARPSVVLLGRGLDVDLQRKLQRACEACGVSSAIPCGSGADGVRAVLAQHMGRAEASEGDAALAADGVCLIVYTSGTTGAPKGAMVRDEGLVQNAWWFARRCGFEAGRTLANLPINHIGCVGDVCATSLVLGSALVFMERFDARRAVQLIRDERVTWLPQVPAQYQLMVTEGGLGAPDLTSVRHLAWGGAAMPSPLIQQLAAWVPDLFNSYGLTECSGTITLSPRGADLAALADTVGEPVEAGRLRVVDAQDVAVPDGEVGEVQIRGGHVFAGYLNRPDATRAAFAEGGWLRTGDVGSIERGSLKLVGRNTEMFKSGGYNVYPREVESVIEQLAGVELCAVLGIVDDLWGEVGVAFVKADAAAISPQQVLAWCADHLSRYKVPKKVVVRDALPLLPVGKVDKQALRMALPA